MKRLLLFIAVAMLGVSTAVPAGTVFATDVIDPSLATETSTVGMEAAAVATHVVITELQTRGVTGANAERIELYNATDHDVDVTDWCAQRASATGSSYTKVFCFTASDNLSSTRVLLPAKSTVLLVSSDTVAASPLLAHDGIFSAGMADSGGRVKVLDATGATVDLLGWGSATESLGSPASAIPSSSPLRSLQRIVSSGLYQDTSNNVADFMLQPAKESYVVGGLVEVTDYCGNVVGVQKDVPVSMVRMSNGSCVERASMNFCDGVMVSEIGANLVRQYIELSNHSTRMTKLDGCALQTNRSTKLHVFDNVSLKPGGSIVVYVDQTELRLTKTTTGTVYLLASDHATEVDSRYYEDLSSDTSWSYFDDGWKQTYTLTPGEANNYVHYPPCGDGQERNSTTGRCRNITSASTLKPCRDGQYRSEETNRCRSIALAAATVLKPCADDQFRNPLTNRCKKIASADELADCGEGRERNPVTNRCRNIVHADVPDAAFAVEPIKQTGAAFAGWWALGGVLLLAFGYAGWEWRYEIRSGVQKLVSQMGRGK